MSADPRAMHAWRERYEPKPNPPKLLLRRQSQLCTDPSSCGPITRLALLARDSDSALRAAEALDAHFGLLDTWLPGEDAQ